MAALCAEALTPLAALPPCACCPRTLPQQIAETAQAVDDLMATDFLERARFGGEGATTSRILQRLAAQLAATQTPRGGPAEGIAAGRSRLSSEGSVGGTEAEVVAAAKLTDPASLDRVAAWVEAVGEEGPPGGMDGGAAGSEEALQVCISNQVLCEIGQASIWVKTDHLLCVGSGDMCGMLGQVYFSVPLACLTTLCTHDCAGGAAPPGDGHAPHGAPVRCAQGPEGCGCCGHGGLHAVSAALRRGCT